MENVEIEKKGERGRQEEKGNKKEEKGIEIESVGEGNGEKREVEGSSGYSHRDWGHGGKGAGEEKNEKGEG